MKWPISPVVLTFCALAGLSSYSIAQSSDDEIKTRAITYVQKRESDLSLANTDTDRYSILYNLCKAAFSAGEFDKATTFANALIAMAPGLSRNPGFGPGDQAAAIHIGNIVLGRIAFQEGKIDDAKKYLLAATDVTTGNPVMRSFGPHMLLARQLLEKGERSTVLEYLDHCAVFWKSGAEAISKWKDVINSGGIPNFDMTIVNFTEEWRFDGN